MVIQKKYTEAELKLLHVKDLRVILRGRGAHGIWVAAAQKDVLVKAILEGRTTNNGAAPTERDVLVSKATEAMMEFAEVFADIILDAAKRKNKRQ